MISLRDLWIIYEFLKVWFPRNFDYEDPIEIIAKSELLTGRDFCSWDFDRDPLKIVFCIRFIQLDTQKDGKKIKIILSK